MKVDSEILSKIEFIYKKYRQLENDLMFEEVLADRKLTAKMEKEKNCLQNIIDKYENFVCLQNDNADDSPELIKAYQNLILALTNSESKIENITIEINFKKGDCSRLSKDISDGYTNFCKSNGYDIKFENKTKNGFLLSVCGNNCFEVFKNENGIHKAENCEIVVLVYPEITKQEVSFDERDLKIDIFRSNGAGGQNVNKVSTAIRIKHLSTGIVVSCQDERSQFQNKERALKNLKEKVYEYVNNNYSKALEKERKKYLSNETIKIYDYKNNIITFCKTKEKFDLQQFINGTYGIKIL